MAYLDLGRTADAFQANRRALDELENLVRGDPRNGRWAYALAWENLRHGDLAYASGDLERAAAGFRQSAEIHAELLSRSSGKPADWQNGLAIAYEMLAEVLAESGDLPGAIDVAERSLATRREMVDVEEQNLFHAAGLASIQVVLGRLRAEKGEDAAATSILQEAGTLLERMATLDPDSASLREELALADLDRGRLMQKLGGLAEARESFERCLFLLEPTLSDPAADDLILEILVEALLLLDRPGKAAPLLHRLRSRGWPAGGDPELVALVARRGL